MSEGEDVEAVLRSLLSAAQDGTLLADLNAEYHEVVGNSIPFEKLGFPSLEAYIRSIPHVIQLEMNQNGRLMARAVSNAAVEHITKLVADQKPTTKRRQGARAGSAFSPRGRGAARQRPRNASRPPSENKLEVPLLLQAKRRSRRRTPYAHPLLDRTQDISCGSVQTKGPVDWARFLAGAGLKQHFVARYAALFRGLGLAVADLDMCTAFDLEKLGVEEDWNVNLLLRHIGRSCTGHTTQRRSQVRKPGPQRMEPHFTQEKKVTWHVGRLMVTVRNELCRTSGATN